VSYVHGDLNAANILVDAHDNVWVIDFFHAGRGHVLKDLAKFENDLLYLLTPIDDDAQLREAISITVALREVADLRAPLADLPDDVRSPHLVRAWEILRVLRSTISQVCHDDRNPLQYQVAALRYAVHTLGFPEPSRLQKESALVAACSLGDQVASTVKANLVLRVDWVESPHIGPGRLGITICPGRRDRDRNLEADLARLRAEGVDRLLCLSTEAELDWAGVGELGSRAEAFGLNYRWLPVPDQGTCSLSEAIDLVGWCRDGLRRGESVVVTCMGGLGRSGMIAACILVDVGLSPPAAIASVRAARGPRALEMRLASQSGVERFETPGGMEQQSWGVAAAPTGERNLRAQALQAGALNLIERGTIGDRQQLDCRVGRRGVELGLRGSERPAAPLRRVGGQLRRVREERGGRRRSPACPRPLSRPLQLGGHLLVVAHRRVSAMPRTPIGVGVRIGRLRQCPMRSSPLGKDRRPVHRGSHERMPEPDTSSDLDKLRVLRRRKRAPFDAKPASRTPYERRIADRFGRGQQEQSLGYVGQFTRPLAIVILEAARKVCRGRKREAACQLGFAHASRQIEQSERVAARFRDDAVADVFVETTRDRPREQSARILLG
jgi:protein-tyrosine phosphatase